MKSIFSLALLFLGFMTTQAQNVADAVRFSQENITGTARYQGVGGAFGALGGDFSAINNNPAGSAVFIESSASVTASLDSYNNETFYNDGITSTDHSDLNFNQFGGVFVLNNSREDSPWRKISFALNYDRAANYDDQFIAGGTSSSSIDSYFLGNAQGFKLSDLRLRDNENITSGYRNIGDALGYQAQQGFLGFQGYILEPTEDNPDNTEFFSTIAPGTFDQGYNQTTSGYSSKLTLNAAAQYGNRFYFGLNLNSHFIDYRKGSVFSENNTNTGSTVTNVIFRNSLSTLGNGFSFQAGGIYKLSPSWRMGATYDSPTWYSIDDEVSQRLSTDGSNGSTVIAPDVVTVFDTYNFRTPGKFTGSLAYVFENIGFLSFDYAYQDFSNAHFKTNDVYDFNFQNNSINDQLQAASSYRLGGEYRAKQFSFRGGYRFEETPYKNGVAIGDLTGFSLGLGYTFGATRLDVAYARSTQELNPRLYDGDFTNVASIDATTSTFLATLSFEL